MEGSIDHHLGISEKEITHQFGERIDLLDTEEVNRVSPAFALKIFTIQEYHGY